MYRDVMLAMTLTSDDELAVQAAVSMCKAYDARLSVSLPFDLRAALSDRFGTTPIVLQRSTDEVRQEMLARAQSVRARLEAEDVRAEVRVSEAFAYSAQHLVAVEARYHDVVIMAMPSESNVDSVEGHALFATLLMESGRPVIVVPPGSTNVAWPPRRAVVAWQPTPEASRAVHEALPLLRRAEHVDVLLSSPVIGEGQHGQEPGADIVAHLRRHQVAADARINRTSRGSTGNDVILSAVEADADLIVAGGYGHSRAREWAFGGVTRELLDRATVPVLLAH